MWRLQHGEQPGNRITVQVHRRDVEEEEEEEEEEEDSGLHSLTWRCAR